MPYRKNFRTPASLLSLTSNHLEPSLSPDSIITVKSQLLPKFSLHQDLSNVNIKLIDVRITASYVAKRSGEGEIQLILLRALEVVLVNTG